MSGIPAALSTFSIEKTRREKEVTARLTQKKAFVIGLLPLRDDAQEAVVKDLDGVDVKQPLRGGDKAEVDRVRSGPYGPRSPDLRRSAERQAAQEKN